MSPDLTLFFAMLAGGLLTFATRVVFLLGGERWKPGETFRALLAYVPPAVLAALIAPEVLVREGALALGLDNPRLWAALAAALVALWTRSVLATIGVGLAVLWGLQLLGG